MLGENAIRFLDLDRSKLLTVADQVGFAIDEITGASAIDAALLDHLQNRCGFAKPAEGRRRASTRSSTWCETTSWQSEPRSMPDAGRRASGRDATDPDRGASLACDSCWSMVASMVRGVGPN